MGKVRPHQVHRRACLGRVGYKRQIHSHKRSGARRKTGSALLMLRLCLSLPKALKGSPMCLFDLVWIQGHIPLSKRQALLLGLLIGRPRLFELLLHGRVLVGELPDRKPFCLVIR